MIADELSGVEKAQAEAANLAGMVRVDLIEFFKDLGNLFRGDARAIILYVQNQFALSNFT